MRTRWNGSIQSSNTPTYDKTGIHKEDYGMYRCMIIKVLYVDDPQNISKNATNAETLYECVILGGWASGQTISNCRVSRDFPHSEKILTATSKDISKSKLQDHDGDIVWVQFVQGHDAYPIITGLAAPIKTDVGTKKADGPRNIEKFNGVTTEITNKGELKTSLTGGTTTDGKFTADTEILINEEWSKDEKITRTYKSGLVVTEDGKNDKVNVTTSGGVSLLLDGKQNSVVVKAGESEITIDGATGKIHLKGEFVDLGKTVSDFATLFTQLATAFATHSHIGNLGAPTSPPLAPLLVSVGSQTVKVQS